jgi:CBS domain-containing membrane protein
MDAESGSIVGDVAARDRVPVWLKTYLGRMRGTRLIRPKIPSLAVIALTWSAAFIGIAAVAIPTVWLGLPTSADLFLIGSFGATAVLLYAVPRSELAQPRNVLGGHFLAALVGVTAFKAVGTDHATLAAALAVATAAIVMQITGTVHPPAGATALIAVLGPAKIQALGYRYAFTPVLLGVAIMVAVAIVFNNLSPLEERHYPTSWF